MTLQIEAKEQQFIKMREQIEAQDKVYNQQSLIYQNEQKDEYQSIQEKDEFLIKI